MSAGAFIRSFYETNGGAIARIRVQPETELFTDGTNVNDAPAGPPTVSTTVKVSKARGEYGISPRKVGFVFDDGQAPAGYRSGQLYYIPILQRSTYDAYIQGTQATYLAGTGEIVSKLEENVK